MAYALHIHRGLRPSQRGVTSHQTSLTVCTRWIISSCQNLGGDLHWEQMHLLAFMVLAGDLARKAALSDCHGQGFAQGWCCDVVQQSEQLSVPADHGSPICISSFVSPQTNGVCQLTAQLHAGTSVPDTFPVVVTSYEIVLADVKFLNSYDWKYLVVDEGHRLKNYNSKLLRELRTLHTTNRLLLTGASQATALVIASAAVLQGNCCKLA